MAKAFQVLKFVDVDFSGTWTRSLFAEAVVSYQAQATRGGPKLAVVVEGATGVYTTYRFDITAGDEAWVIHDVIHVPAHCAKEEAGNTVKCP